MAAEAAVGPGVTEVVARGSVEMAVRHTETGTAAGAAEAAVVDSVTAEGLRMLYRSCKPQRMFGLPRFPDTSNMFLTRCTVAVLPIDHRNLQYCILSKICLH